MQIQLALIPVYLFILIGYLCRKVGWLNQQSDESLFKVQLNIFYPSLIFGYIFQNEALRNPELIIIPPLTGFITVCIGFAVGYLVARGIRLQSGKGLRTFAYTTGIYNYGFIAIPLINSVFNEKSVTGTMMVYNTGIDFAIWSIGILLLSGSINKGWWKKLINAPLLGLFLGITLNFVVPIGFFETETTTARLLDPIYSTILQLGNCAIPVALILIGASIRDLIGDRSFTIDWKVIFGGLSVRLMLVPFFMILGAALLPLPNELKKVVLIQSAMPSGMFPIIMARHYGGNPSIAVQLVLSTTIVSFITIPIWVSLAQRILGL